MSEPNMNPNPSSSSGIPQTPVGLPASNTAPQAPRTPPEEQVHGVVMHLPALSGNEAPPPPAQPISPNRSVRQQPDQNRVGLFELPNIEQPIIHLGAPDINARRPEYAPQAPLAPTRQAPQAPPQAPQNPAPINLDALFQMVDDASNLHRTRLGNLQGQGNPQGPSIEEMFAMQMLTNRLTQMGDYLPNPVFAPPIFDPPSQMRPTFRAPVGAMSQVQMQTGRLATQRPEIPAGNLIQCRLPTQVNHVPEHKIVNNTLYMTINRLEMNPEIAKERLNLLVAYLRRYKESGGDFARLGLNIRYSEEAGIDSGGPTRDYMDQIHQILKLLLAENPFFGLEKEYYNLTNAQSTTDPKNLELCHDLGVFFAAIFSGFPTKPPAPPAKIGGVFSDRFYSHLLATYKYAQEHPQEHPQEHLGPLKPFSSMTKEEAEAFTKTISDYDLENVVYKNVNHNFEKEKFTDDELNNILLFLVYDKVQLGDSIDDDLTELLEEKLAKLYEQFPKQEDFNKLFNTPQQIEFPEPLRDRLRIVLSDTSKKAQIKQQFIDSRTNTYANRSIPLVAIGEGFFNTAPRNKVASIINKLAATPLEATQELATAIQGPPFTKEKFIDLLAERTIIHSSIKDKDLVDVHEKLGWLIEWCRDGIPIDESGEILRKATEEEMQDTLRAFTGSRVIPQQLRLEFRKPCNGMCEFHTCFNYMHPGRLLLDEKDKIKFIKLWTRNVNEALLTGFQLT